jgi:hypothetical protein
MGGGLGCLPPPSNDDDDDDDDPLAHRVAKFSHAKGATSQKSLTTIRLPAVGGRVSMPPHSLCLEAHSVNIWEGIR